MHHRIKCVIPDKCCLTDKIILLSRPSEYSKHHNFIRMRPQLHEYDKELGDFDGRLFEFPISFVPSYPFEEDVAQGANYMLTRVPAWCDRILLSPTAKSLVKDVSIYSSISLSPPLTLSFSSRAHTP